MSQTEINMTEGLGHFLAIKKKIWNEASWDCAGSRQPNPSVVGAPIQPVAWKDGVSKLLMLSVLHSHTSRGPAASPPCPVSLGPSGPRRASPTTPSTNPSGPPPSLPSASLTPPSAGSQRGGMRPSSTPASTRLARTWTWTYGTRPPTAAPTRSSPTTRATAEMFNKIKEKKMADLANNCKHVKQWYVKERK